MSTELVRRRSPKKGCSFLAITRQGAAPYIELDSLGNQSNGIRAGRYHRNQYHDWGPNRVLGAFSPAPKKLMP
jgi:hypothetical protein